LYRKEGNKMVAYVLGALILGYTGFIIYRKAKDVKAGKSCCSGCSGCPSKEVCGK
jgi:hypothetical protein